MKVISFLFLTAWLGIFQARGQAFNRVYTHNNIHSDANGIVEDSQGNFIIICDVFNGPTFVEVRKLNAYGDTLWNTIIKDTNYAIQSAAYGDGGIVLISDTLIAISGTRFNASTGNADGYYCLLDSSGTILQFITFGGADEYFFSSLISLSDGNLLIGGNRNDSLLGDFDVFLMKITLNGSIIWEVKYPRSTLFDAAWSVTELTNGGFLIAGNIHLSPDFYNYLIKTDSLGAFQWDTTWIFLQISTLTGVTQLANGDWLVSGQCEDGFLNDKGYLARMDGQGNILWQKAYGNTNLGFDNRPIELDGGCIMASGNGFKQANDGPYGLIMIVTGSGDSLWTDFYNFRNVTNPPPAQFYDVIVSGDGYVCVGYAHDSLLGQSAWVVRLDSSNVPSCLMLTGVHENAEIPNSIIAYPNPFNEELNISTSHFEQSEIILYDLASRILLRRKFTHSVSLNTTVLARGIYLYEIRMKNGMMKKGKVVKE